MADNKLNSFVTNIIQVSASMKIMRVKPDNWEFPAFKGGQFNVLGLYGSSPKVS